MTVDKDTTRQHAETRARYTPAPRRGGERGPVVGAAALLGLLVVAAATLGLVLDFAAPWAFEPSGGGLFDDRTVHREDFVVHEEDVGAYLHSFTTWPLVAWLGAMSAGGLLVAVTVLTPALSAARHLRSPIAASLVLVGALLVIAKLRLLGLMWTPLFYGQAPQLHPHVASYYQLAGGLLFILVGGALLLPALRAWYGAAPLNPLRLSAKRVPLLTCLGVLVTLALLPVIPYAGTETGFTAPDAPLTEYELAVAAEGDGELATAGGGLATARVFLWTAFWISIVAATAGILARAPARRAGLWENLQPVQLIVIVPLLLALGHGIVHFVALWRALEALPLFNWLPVLAPIALLALQFSYYKDAAMPAAATQRTTREPPSAGRKVAAPSTRSEHDEDIEEIIIESAPGRAARHSRSRT